MKFFLRMGALPPLQQSSPQSLSNLPLKTRSQPRCQQSGAVGGVKTVEAFNHEAGAVVMVVAMVEIVATGTRPELNSRTPIIIAKIKISLKPALTTPPTPNLIKGDPGTLMGPQIRPAPVTGPKAEARLTVLIL